MKRIAIIGAGVSGLTAAQLLKEKAEVVVFERETKAGGLIQCERVNGSLFHTCGGHVFNTQNQVVLEWFWQRFNKDAEFVKTNRNSVIVLPNGQHIPYPIENYAYLLDEQTQKSFIQDLLQIATAEHKEAHITNFQAFLQSRFGKTLYKLYFEPYNKKVWRRELNDVPIDWLAGKLPMPTVEEIIFNNFNRVAEKQFVHSTFFYEKQGGSQLIANRLAEGLEIRYNADIQDIRYAKEKWTISGETFDAVVFCGNIKDIPHVVHGVDIKGFAQSIDALQYHGTTSVFCEIDANPYSWMYLPDNSYRAHRIICTGNFSPSNDGLIAKGRTTATVEFTDEINKDNILENLQRIPLHPTYITHKNNQYTYPIQQPDTRDMITSLKLTLSALGFYMSGRFADWEYYNMDVAIAAAMKTIEQIKL